MPVAIDGTMLPDDDWDQLQEFADRFADARSKGPMESWDEYLPPAGSRLRRSVVLEIAKVDLELAWREGKRTFIEEYAKQNAELNPPPVGLIVEEHNIRKRSGDKPEMEEYRKRFPAQFEEFKQQVLGISPNKSVIQTKRKDTKETPPESLVAPKAPEGYRLIERIGRGNFGEVWKAEAPGGIEVALKIVSQPLDHDAAQRELKSLELIKKLQHPTLLATLAFWIIDNRLVIAMELADGSLRDRLKECRSHGQAGIPADELLTYFRDTAVGLDHLHWQKVLHRDIKPENILLKHGYAKVADFGLARAQQGALMSVSFAGTPAFMAPEVWGGKACEQSDQYSLAFTYAELRLGRRPLEGADFVTVMNAALEQVPDLGDIPQPEKVVLLRALAKKPEERFTTCQDFVEALARAVGAEGTIPRRRNVPVTVTAGGRVDSAQTERSTHGIEAPKKPTDNASTIRTDPSAATGKPVVWKPPGPMPAKKSMLPVVIGVGVLVLVIGVGGFFGIKALLSNGGGNPTSASVAVDTRIPVPPTDKPTPSKKNPPIEERADYIPANCVAFDPKEKLVTIGGKKYHRRLMLRKASQEIEFVILPADFGGKPYYTMVRKAWNGLMAAYAAENAGDVPNNTWKDAEPFLPATNMTVDAAIRVAAWMGGKLPTTQQWDFAAAIERRTSTDGAAVSREKPRAVNFDHGDQSPAGVQDMLGNGREFTRNLIGGAMAPKSGATENDFIILRGRMWTLARGLTLEDMNFERENPQRQFYTKASTYTGFRVVLEVE